MYKQEKVIEGVLHYKTHPQGKWIPYSLEQLTERCLYLEKNYNLLLQKYEDSK